MIVAVTGATGYVGQFVVRDLLEAGHRVRVLARGAVPPWLGPVEAVAGGLGDAGAARALVEGADGLVHAAFSHEPGRYRGGEGDDLGGFLAVNLMGSLDLLRAAREAGVKSAVVLSSRAVYGRLAREGDVLAENAPLRPDTHYGALKLALEGFVSAWGAEGWRVTALRPTGVYGIVEPFDRTKWLDLARAVLEGRASSEARAGTEVHGAEVASAVRLLLAGGAPGRAYNCGDLALAAGEVARRLGAAAGVEGRLPLAGMAPKGVMHCDGLEALGWRPGGARRLDATLGAMVRRLRPALRSLADGG
ncbi:MAG: SDR family oxidoreductase [Geminicoccaceae bacterium]|nr:SDR family oxidoreductase [Geminicoccaceae bacterium]